MSQVLINTAVATGVIILVGLGFGLIFHICRFFHFAHGLIITVGAYLNYVGTELFSLPAWVSIPLSVALCALLGCMMEIGIYRPLRRRQASALVLLLSSLGLYVAGTNIISLVFGDQTQLMATSFFRQGIAIPGGYITLIQALIIISALTCVSLIVILMKYTLFGQKFRAVADDIWLSEVVGIRPQRFVLYSFSIGSALAGLSGILLSVDIGMSPSMGLRPLLLGVIAAIIGGVGSIYGIILGSCLLAVTQNVGSWYVGNEWQDSIAFGLLLCFLLLKPEGFFGKPLDKNTV